MSIFTPIANYGRAVKNFYIKSFSVLLARYPSLSNERGTLQEFQMQKGIVFDLLSQHWVLVKAIYAGIKIVLFTALALILKYLNLVLCLVLVLTAPAWIPFTMMAEAWFANRLNKKFTARAAKDVGEL